MREDSQDAVRAAAARANPRRHSRPSARLPPPLHPAAPPLGGIPKVGSEISRPPLARSHTSVFSRSFAAWQEWALENEDPSSARAGQKTAPWTRTEDQVISEAVKRFGCKWGVLSALLPGRTDNAVRNRWHRLER
ncbi:hypothetical protein T492DRAFT_627182, partial [Pavlovales sp. CCMP2436]